MLDLVKAYDARETGKTGQLVLAAAHAFIGAQATDGAAIIARHIGQPRYQPTFTQLARQNGRVVGAALLGHQRMRLGAATLDVGAASLFVDQGCDLTDAHTSLIGSMLGVFQDSALPFAVLHDTPALFAPFGFAPYQLATTIADWHAPAPARLRPLEAADLDDVSALYAASYASLPYADVRTAADWRAWLAAHVDSCGIDDAHGRLVAYTSSVGSQIAEVAAADGGAARALLAALPAGCQLALGLQHPVAQVALHAGGIARVRKATTPLAGIVDLAGAVAQLAPALEARLASSRYAGWSGRVQIESGDTPVTLACVRGQITIATGAQPADVRLQQVTLTGLPQLCLGARAISDLRATGELACDDTELGLLETLFPPLI